MPVKARTTLGWSLWLATFGCCAAGLLVTLVVTRPLTLAVLAEGAAFALAYPLGYATIGLVLSLRRPANPIGWLYAAAGLLASLAIPLEPWVTQLVGEQRPVPLAAQVGWVLAQPMWAPAIACGAILPLLLLPDGRLRSRRWRPVAAAVAMLRYRLWDLDRLVSRTVTYTVVTALLAVPYLLIVPAAGHLAAGSGSLAVAALTLAAAAAFQPLRRRVQDLVDRRFNRARYDAAHTVERFAVRLRDQVDLDVLHTELLAVSTRRCSRPGPGCGCSRRRPRGCRGSAATRIRRSRSSTRHPRPYRPSRPRQ